MEMRKIKTDFLRLSLRNSALTVFNLHMYSISRKEVSSNEVPYEARADRIGDVALVDWMCRKQGERIPRKCGQVLRKL